MREFTRFAAGTKDMGFEKYCKNLLEHMGYQCALTSETGDNGIDIIATDVDGVKYGIQCKNWDANVGSNIVRELSGSIVDQRLDKGKVFTTANFTKAAKDAAERCGIDIWNWSRIEKESSNIEGLEDDILEEEEYPTDSPLFAHNEEVYNQVEEYLSKDNKAIVILGTGMGKTTTALEYCYRHQCRALVLCPKNIIKEDWEVNKCVDGMTYSAFAMQYKDLNYDKYGIIICDEVHHAGAETWGAGVEYLINNGIKVLGLTATQVRTDGVDVSNRLFGDNICLGMNVLEGIEAGILYPFSYIGAYYDAEKVCKAIKDKYKDRLNESLVGRLDLALNNTPCLKDIIKNNMPEGARKGIIFTENISDMEKAISIVREVYPDAIYKKLHSNLSLDDQRAVKEWFKNTNEGFLCSINMVSEGVHYDNVNTLFMLRRTKSSIIFEQQIGRVVTQTKKANPNAIVFDLVNNSKTVQNFKTRISQVRIPGTSIPDIDAVRRFSGTVGFNIDGSVSKQVVCKEYVNTIEKVLEEIHSECDAKPWTEEEDKIIIKYYPTEGTAVFKRLKNRNRSACEHRAKKLGIKFENYFFTPEEDEILKKYYILEQEDIVKRLPYRTYKSCQTRARALKLFLPSKKWTEEEDKILIEHYPIGGLAEVKLLLPNRSESSIRTRLSDLHIKKADAWTKEMDAILKKYYPIEGQKVSKRLDKSESSCVARAQRLGIISQYGVPKKVMCLETQVIYNSTVEAARACGSCSGSISACCKGKMQTTKGYHWKYVEE